MSVFTWLLLKAASIRAVAYESAALTVELWARWVLSPVLSWVRAWASIVAGLRRAVVSTSPLRYQLDGTERGGVPSKKRILAPRPLRRAPLPWTVRAERVPLSTTVLALF